jgi:hypothetical protein
VEKHVLPRIARNRLAAVALAVASLVLLLAPVVLDAPNPLAPPAAGLVALGALGAWHGGKKGRRIGLAVSAAGLLVSLLWFGLASDGFGQGAAWWDDMLEAGILAAAFLTSVVLLWRRLPASA